MSLKDNIVEVYKGEEPFWGKYKDLNNATVPELKDIQEYQLYKIRQFQKASSAKAAKKYSKINNLFKSRKINQMTDTYDKKTSMTLDKAITGLVGIINGTYQYNKDNKTNTSYNYDALQKQLLSLNKHLNTINQILINSGESKGIPSHYLDKLQDTINACGLHGLDDTSLDNWFNQINLFKGDLVEDIGVEWLKSQKIPNILTVNTGALDLQGEIKAGRHTGQLIQDLMMLDVSNISILNTPITYKPIGSPKTINSTLGQLLKDMEASSGNSKKITITDETYDTLLKFSALNIQAKAGFNQKPWNINKSNQVKIGEFSETDGLALSVRRTFELLHQLDLENTPEPDIWVKNSSPDYNMLADYGLATVLFKILHLEEQGNQYLLTPEGFTTYTQRIKTLMEKRQSRIHIKGKVTINSNTLGTDYDVTMTNYK